MCSIAKAIAGTRAIPKFSCPPNGPSLPKLLPADHSLLLKPGWVTLQMHVLPGEEPVEELERYERQRRPVALEYVNRITIANKRHLEMHDAEEQRRWRAELAHAASDRAAQREYMLRISMIASLRKYECA